MASCYNRRINLFINGQQVSNDVRTIREEMTRLVNEQAWMTLGSQEYIAHARRIRDLRSIRAEHNQQIAAISRSWSLSRMGDAFTKTGSARPELLRNKEALVRVKQEAIILSNAAKTTLQPAIEALTMAMNQYNVPATEARRIINALGAGSKEGAGEIP